MSVSGDVVGGDSDEHYSGGKTVVNVGEATQRSNFYTRIERQIESIAGTVQRLVVLVDGDSAYNNIGIRQEIKLMRDEQIKYQTLSKSIGLWSTLTIIALVLALFAALSELFIIYEVFAK